MVYLVGRQHGVGRGGAPGLGEVQSQCPTTVAEPFTHAVRLQVFANLFRTNYGFLIFHIFTLFRPDFICI